MGLFKGLMLGSAAAVTMAAGSAFAADLPSRKAAPVAYVKICDVYGRGFYYIPGTNTCLRVGGRVRFDLGWHKAQNVSTVNTGAITARGRVLDTLGWRARAYINMDARTQTAWGTVQTVFSVAIRSHSGAYNLGPAVNNGPGGRTTNTPQVYAAYIRFAGFTFGRAPHVFSNGPGHLFYMTNWAGGGAIGVTQLSYTALFGGGFSATLSIEDANDYANQRVAFPPMVSAPNRLPNLVLSLRVDQGWGYARLSAAIGRNSAVNAAQTITRHKTGWALGGDVRVNLPSIARGDAIYFSVAYSDGLIDYVTGSNVINGVAAKDGRLTGGWNVPNANVSGSIGCAIGGACLTQTWKAWRAMVAFTHYWTPSLRSNFAVSYLRITPPSSITNAAVGFPKSSAWQASGNIIWSPTAGFDIGLELYYANIRHRTRNAAIATTLRAGGVKSNPDDWAVRLRVQRTF